MDTVREFKKKKTQKTASSSLALLKSLTVWIKKKKKKKTLDKTESDSVLLKAFTSISGSKDLLTK